VIEVCHNTAHGTTSTVSSNAAFVVQSDYTKGLHTDMTTPVLTRRKATSAGARNYLVHVVLTVLAGLALIPFYLAFHRKNPKSIVPGRKKVDNAVPSFKKGSLTLSNNLDQRDVPFYRCGDNTMRSIILLHGARFTKEDWKTSGILTKFCTNGFAAVALDLNVNASAAKLLAALSQLQSRSSISAEPIDAIITPSASGFTIMDGLINGQAEGMKKHIKRWIPVATNSALQHSESDLVAAKGWPMLAVYGDQDDAGKSSSRLWERVSGATVVELKVRADSSTTIFAIISYWAHRSCNNRLLI
jgi:hypothetical protein